MFSKSQGATATYRTLARGAGCDWSRTYMGLQERHTPQIDKGHRERATKALGSSRIATPAR